MNAASIYRPVLPGSSSAVTPRQELADLTAHALARGLTLLELSGLQKLGDDGYGVIARIEQLYVWLERHPRARLT